jgi:sirohydrochlorin ferrochelatase
MLSVGDLLDSLVSQNHLTEEGKRILASELPERVPRNWDASEYVALAREARDGRDELVWRQMPHELCDFRNMGFDIGMGHLE